MNPLKPIEGPVAVFENPITDTDSYKASHWTQYPPGVTSMYSYFESRGGRYGHSVFFGLQYLLRGALSRPITRSHVDDAARFFEAHGEPFNRDGWEHIVDRYAGRLPVRIRAVPEGTVVPAGNVLFDVELAAPDPKAFWVVSWLETMLVRLWYPCTVATLSRHCKETILAALQASADDPAGEIPFKLHDFGSRGGSSEETIRIGGAAHLVNFLGSDTVEGVRLANRYYDAPMAGFSIPAAEHSTITMWGREREEDAYANFVQRYLVDRVVPAGAPKIAACVSDSYDVFRAIEELWCGPRLLPMIRASGGKLVIRPDSGDPITVLLRCLEVLERKVGMAKNTKGYKVLPPYLGLIQGDGINDQSLGEILRAVTDRGYSASNLGFGMGGGLLQQVNRDTQKYAFKCAAALVDGTWVDVSKSPATDMGKRSKRGHQALVREGAGYQTVRGPRADDLLVPVFESGVVLKTYDLETVRANAARGLGA
ncbi:MAG TPA: nicotinate phosphoribosyltransferase [Polyangiaceae bacterium]|jgi:nicotinamide phosphoribosyltransferase|nr:nicotinate phosphoribosyltransferase [Polyangiaceae bacterium]